VTAAADTSEHTSVAAIGFYDRREMNAVSSAEPAGVDMSRSPVYDHLVI
jgi:hypothetical protein